MTIVITLSSELETRLQAIADLQSRDINLVASELLASILTEEEDDLETDLELQQSIEQARTAYQTGEYVTLSELKAELAES